MRRLLLTLAPLMVSLCAQPVTIRNWGNNEMRPLLTRWETAFQKTHPFIRFENKLFGPASALAGIYTGVADLSWAGHELWKEESMGFEWVFQYKPLGIEVATASLDVHQNGAALVVFVHKDNPLKKLTLAQVDAIFGSEHRRGGKTIRTWGDLGLAGEWATQPVRPYGYDAETEAAAFFRQSVLKDSYKWACNLTEFRNVQRQDGSIIDAGPEILNALSTDRYGIAYSKLKGRTESVKPIALAASDEGPFWEPIPNNIQQRHYPLSRVMMVYLNRAKGKPIEPALKEFLVYVLSADGQRQVIEEGGYFPLTPESVARQLRALE